MKDRILNEVTNVLNDEITLLIEAYESQITVLKQQNDSLKLEIANLTARLKQETVVTVENDPFPPFSTYIDAVMNESNSERVRALQLDVKVAAETVNQLEPIAFKKLFTYFKDVLQQNTNQKVEQLILGCFTKLDKKQIKVLKENVHETSAIIKKWCQSLTNSIEKIRVLSLLSYDMTTKEYIQYLLKHAEEIKPSFHKHDIECLFWYAYLYDEDVAFMNAFQLSREWLQQSDTLMLYVNAKNKGTSTSKSKKNKLLTILSTQTYAKVMTKLNKSIVKEVKPTPHTVGHKQKVFNKNNLYVIKDKEMERFIQNMKLLKKRIVAEAMEQGGVFRQVKRVVMDAYINSNKTAAYIAESQYKLYQDKFSPLTISSSKYYYNFVWPSTQSVQSSKLVKNTEKPPLREVSNIKAYGYSYQLPESKRREILKRCVQEQGLRSVAYTLATNVRRLKGRSPGSIAINVWEEDLAEMKRMYYDNTFEWPY